MTQMEDGADAEGSVQSGEGDFVVVERVQSPTEAHIIRNCLESAGIAAHVADANTVQANWVWTVAVGGVRVMVRQSMAEQAKEVVAQYRAGALVLEGESIQAPATVPLEPGQALWNPDAAAAWSLWVTPLFGCVLHLLNARTLRNPGMVRASLVWLTVCAAATGVVMTHMLRHEQSAAGLLVASSLLSPLTCLWYVFSARDQSKFIVERHGRKYRKHFILVALIPALLLYYLPAMFG
ncbi:putative signal transducing protein [Piscinibacter terrae]|nr:DUF2007 domain-containing protein [Albitalea terrae]